jgi:hypothetical protein
VRACRSPQIATTKISWSCAAAPSDVISIEVWEVIDRRVRRVDGLAAVRMGRHMLTHHQMARASKKTAAVVPPSAELSLEHRAKKNVAAAEARPTGKVRSLVLV